MTSSAATPGQPAHPDGDGSRWSGRKLSSTGFDGDTGDADPRLLEALAARAAGPSVEQDERLMCRVAAARWIVPLVAAPTSVEGVAGPLDEHGVERSADLAVVTLTAPDGRRALPIFTSAAALGAWHVGARPVPVSAVRAAQAALTEGCEVVVIDVGSNGATELRPSMVRALSEGREWRPAHLDPLVAQSVSRAVAPEQSVVENRLAEGAPTGSGTLRVVLGIAPGLRQVDIEALTTRVAERLASDREFRARVDELTFALATSTL